MKRKSLKQIYIYIYVCPLNMFKETLVETSAMILVLNCTVPNVNCRLTF